MNLSNIKLQNFSYVSYNKNNIEHVKFMDDILNDELTKRFFSNFKEIFSTIDNDIINGFIVEKDNIPIGLVTLIQNSEKNYIFSHVVSPNYRGKRYSSILKEELLDYIFENNLAENIICYIDKSNKNSISSMLRTNPDSIEVDQNDNNMLKVIYKNKILENNIKKL